MAGIVHRDIKKLKQLTNFTSGIISEFTWSRDGKQIFLVRNVSNSELILIKDAKQNQERFSVMKTSALTLFQVP